MTKDGRKRCVQRLAGVAVVAVAFVVAFVVVVVPKGYSSTTTFCVPKCSTKKTTTTRTQDCSHVGKPKVAFVMVAVERREGNS